VPAIAIAPRVAWAGVRRIGRCARARCTEEERRDIAEVAARLARGCAGGATAVFALAVLVVLARKRLALCFAE
jgi:hypothetical protein